MWKISVHVLQGHESSGGEAGKGTGAWSAVASLTNLVWEGGGDAQQVHAQGQQEGIALGWAKAIAACANSRVLTAMTLEDDQRWVAKGIPCDRQGRQ